MQETAALVIFVLFVVPGLEDCCARKDYTLVTNACKDFMGRRIAGL
jgi:hypothetical protein